MSVEFRPEAAFGKILGKTETMVANASMFLADRARERAPIGKLKGRGKLVRPGHPVELRPLKEFGKAKGLIHSRDRQQELFDLNASALGRAFKPEDTFRFRLAAGPHKGETPDVVVRGKRGILRGAKAYTPGGLRRGIHPMEVQTGGSQVRGGVRSEASYSAPIEYGFHHKSGKTVTSVKGQRFMQKALEQDTREAFQRGDFFPK